jgi:hypothetical protein
MAGEKSNTFRVRINLLFRLCSILLFGCPFTFSVHIALPRIGTHRHPRASARIATHWHAEPQQYIVKTNPSLQAGGKSNRKAVMRYAIPEKSVARKVSSILKTLLSLGSGEK